jgi:hypothetical protein
MADVSAATAAPAAIFGTVNLKVIRSQKIRDNIKTVTYLISHACYL